MPVCPEGCGQPIFVRIAEQTEKVFEVKRLKEGPRSWKGPGTETVIAAEAEDEDTLDTKYEVYCSECEHEFEIEVTHHSTE